MATYTTLRQGNSNTSENKKLQQALKDAGYGSYLGSAGVDGIYGSGTAAAVTAYQRDNGLDVDGIAGNQTLGHLYGNTSTSAASANTAQAPAVTWQVYEQPDNVKQAGALLDEHLAAKPGDFTWEDQSLLDEYEDAWLNREGFSYDLNSDPMYQQYKDMYTQQGQLAMLDTMGQAAALTGGYGSSYGQSVGQQAYQSYLQQLNEVVPELYSQAWNRYQAEGEELYNRYAALNAERQQAYGEHQDGYNQWLNMLNYLNSDYQYQDQTAYGQHVDDYNAKYGEYRDMIADRQYQEQMAYQKERDAIADRQWQKEYDLSAAKVYVGDDGTVDLGSAPDFILDQVAACKTPEEAEEVLLNAEAAKIINHDQALALMASYNAPTDKELPLMERQWSVENNGGVNWFWGVDNNATVKDNSGNIYRLDDLIDALVEEGVPEATAKTWVKDLQKNLGI